MGSVALAVGGISVSQQSVFALWPVCDSHMCDEIAMFSTSSTTGAESDLQGKFSRNVPTVMQVTRGGNRGAKSRMGGCYHYMLPVGENRPRS